MNEISAHTDGRDAETNDVTDKLQTLLQAVGAEIRRLRQGNDWTLDDLSSRTGIHLTTLSSIERGQAATTASNLHKIARTLQTTVARLFRTAERDTEEPVPDVTRQRETGMRKILRECTDLAESMGLTLREAILRFGPEQGE